MPKAIWNGQILADSDHTLMVEGNHYFPVDSVNHQFFIESATHTICAWKGTASYYHVQVDGKINQDAAWYYPDPSDAASNIKNHIAFWHGIEVIP